jgi:hypothetical protein
MSFAHQGLSRLAPALMRELRAADDRRTARNAKEKQETLDALAENIPGVIYQRILRSNGTLEYPVLSKGTIDIS